MSSKAEAQANSERTAITHVTIERKALQTVLGALEGIHPGNMTPMAEEYWNKAMTVAKQALEQPVQEPVEQEGSATGPIEDAQEYISLLDATRKKMKVVSNAEHYIHKASIGLHTALRGMESTRFHQNQSEVFKYIQMAAACLDEVRQPPAAQPEPVTTRKIDT